MKAILKKILSRERILRLKAMKARFEIQLLRIFASHGVLSSIYYLLFSKEFYREHRAVLNGRINYKKQHVDFSLTSSALLRRNIHRLEKGMIMRPLKATFASNYIFETVHAFSQMIHNDYFCSEEKQWASDVLSRYFEMVEDTEQIRLSRQLFMSLDVKGSAEYIPYTHQSKVIANILPEQLLTLYQQRRSTRWFKSEKVPSELLDKAINMAAWAPSACNRQPFSFFVANDAKLACEIAEMAGGTGGFANNIPCTIAVVGHLSAYPLERDRHLIYIDGALASMQLMLAFETLGLSSCPINWPDIEEKEKGIARKLNLTVDNRVIMLIAVGYADAEGMIPYSSKKTVNSLRVDVA